MNAASPSHAVGVTFGKYILGNTDSFQCQFFKFAVGYYIKEDGLVVTAQILSIIAFIASAIVYVNPKAIFLMGAIMISHQILWFGRVEKIVFKFIYGTCLIQAVYNMVIGMLYRSIGEKVGQVLSFMALALWFLSFSFYKKYSDSNSTSDNNNDESHSTSDDNGDCNSTSDNNDDESHSTTGDYGDFRSNDDSDPAVPAAALASEDAVIPFAVAAPASEDAAIPFAVAVPAKAKEDV